MKRLSLLFPFIVFSIFLNAEINIGTSLDYFTTASDVIVKGKIIDLKSLNTADGYTAQFIVQVIDEIKGETGKEIRVFSDYYASNWNSEDFKGKNVLLFMQIILDKEDQFQLLRSNNFRHESMMDLDNGSLSGFTANFKVLEIEKDVIAYIKKINLESKGLKSEPGFLEIPYESEAHAELYAGSTCYLIVPKSIFSAAKDHF